MARTTKTSTAEQEVHLRPLAQSLPMTLLRAREACMAEFRPMLHEHKLTEQQWRVLRVLMENDGLVKKRAQRIDQRRAQVMMTAKGQRLYRAVAPHSSEIYRQLEKRLGKQRLEELNSMLQDIENDLADS